MCWIEINTFLQKTPDLIPVSWFRVTDGAVNIKWVTCDSCKCAFQSKQVGTDYYLHLSGIWGYELQQNSHVNYAEVDQLLPCPVHFAGWNFKTNDNEWNKTLFSLPGLSVTVFDAIYNFLKLAVFFYWQIEVLQWVRLSSFPLQKRCTRSASFDIIRKWQFDQACNSPTAARDPCSREAVKRTWLISVCCSTERHSE